MSQNDLVIANQSFPSFRTDLNSALQAIFTTHSGTSLPSGASAGTIWLDTTSATTPTLKYYDGTDNISLATIDHVGNTVNWLDSTVSITGLSTTATGTVLTLSDSASTSTVNLIIDNQKEVRFRETTANGTNYVALKAPASLSADLTFTLPTADGTNGQVLSTNGSGVLSFVSASAGLAFQSVIKTSGFTAVAGEGYFCNTTSSAFTVTLPASPSAGNQVAIVDYAGTFDTNALTINPNSNKIEGGTGNLQLTGEREGVLLVYADSTQGWLATSGINEGTDSLSPTPYSVDFLVIAGGGGGGFDDAGGGGAGGYRNSFGSETSGGGGTSETELTFNGGVVYTITVGAGGTGSSANPSNGSNGSDSSISGTGITTITSTGGGKGGNYSVGSNGGSGGGGHVSGSTAGGSGTANQGFGGSAGTSSGSIGGGGGGAGEIGATDGQAEGGDGLGSSITGSSVTRGGGGGGGTRTAPVRVGGDGGGGTGGLLNTSAATAGTANTGSGGGGGSGSPSHQNGGNGGSGVVILSMADASYSGTTTGSPTVTTGVSGKTVLVFNASGTYTG